MMKQYLFLLSFILFLGINCQGQNAIVGNGFSTGWGGTCPSTGNGDFEFFTMGAGSSYISPTLNANGTGNQFWRFGVDWSGTTKQLTNTLGSDVDVSPGTKYTLNSTCTNSGALRYNVASTTYNYIFKTRDAGTSPTGDWTFFEVQGTVQSVSSVSQNLATVYPGQTLTITANLSGGLSTGQGVYLRYTNDGFGTSTVVEMTGAGITYTANIPASANIAGNSVSYYLFTSGSGLSITHSDADLYTINLNNDGGTNYSYTVESSWTSASNGNWNVASTWDANAVPEANQPVTIENDVNITNSLSSTAPSSITINSGSNLTLSSTPNTTVTNIINNGTFTCASGSTASLGILTNNTGGLINLESTSAINFATLINNAGATLTLKDGSNLGIASTTTNLGTINVAESIGQSAYLGFSGDFTNSGTVNVFGTFARAAQSAVTVPNYSGTAPMYNTGSILGYAQFEGANFTVTGEWTTGTGSTVGAGQPDNVALATASGTGGTWTLNLPAYDVGFATSLTLGPATFVSAANDVPTLIQNSSFGNDLYARGSITNNGTFTGNDRAIFFEGSGAKTISGTGISNFSFVFVNEGTVEYQKNISITNDLTIASSTSLISEASAGRILSMSGGNFINNGTFTANDGTVSFSGGIREVQGSSTSTFYNVTTSNGVDFVNTNIANISNMLTIQSGGFVNTASAPNYNSGSTLNYATGGAYSADESWYENTLSGAGVPDNISVTNNTDLNFSNNGFFRQMTGNLSIESGSSFSLSTASGGDLQIGGNFVNNGTFTHNTRRITFNGTADQNLTGVSNLAFITVNKASGDVKLNNAISIDNEVIMTQGTFDLNGNNMTLNGTTSFIQENTGMDYLIVDKTADTESSPGGAIIATNRDASSDVAGLGINIGGVDAGTLNISRYAYKADNGNAGPRTFDVSGTISGTATLQILNYGSDTPASAKQWKWDSTNGWQEDDGSNITSFSFWTLAEGSASLPISLLSFKGQRIDDNVVNLIWQTASERDNLGFEIQESQNGIDFEKVAFVDGAGNSSLVKNYEFLVNNSFSAYYRLKQIDFDGKATFSNIVFVESSEEHSFKIYPNPIVDNQTLNINLPQITDSDNIQVNIYTINGRKIETLKGSLKSVKNLLNQKIRILDKGIYLLNFQTGFGIYKEKLIKE